MTGSQERRLSVDDQRDVRAGLRGRGTIIADGGADSFCKPAPTFHPTRLTSG
jgi:hypothetical protein